MELFYLGKINGTHHLKGTTKLFSVFGKPEKLDNNKVIVEKPNGQRVVLTITNAKTMNQKVILVDFDEIKNKNDAQTIMGGKVYIRRDILGNMSEEEFYSDDLIDMDVVTNKGEVLGKVTDIMETAAHDIIVINEDENEIMIPSVEEFVLEINFETRKITVDIPDSLRDLNKK